jgi:hypothetical protein
MKKGLILVVTIVAVILIGNVVIASAQNGATPDYPPMGAGLPGWGTGTYSSTTPYRGNMMGGYYRGTLLAPGGMHEQIWTAVAQKLGMTYDELTQAVQNGRTIAQLAEAKGVKLEDLQKAATDAAKAALDDLVKQGTLTQVQADWMLDRMDDMPMFGFGAGNGLGFGPGTGNCPMGGQSLQPGARSGNFGPGQGRGMMRWNQPTGRQG